LKKTEKITTIERLVHELQLPDPSYSELGTRLALTAEELLPLAVWDNERYTRVCVSKTSAYELLLLCWPPNTATQVHCHNGEECWVHLIDGEFEESIYTYDVCPLELKRKNHMKHACTSYMNDTIGLHKLHNISNQRALSLHLYVGPIHQCSRFNIDTMNFEQTSLVYDKVVSLPI